MERVLASNFALALKKLESVHLDIKTKFGFDNYLQVLHIV